jgi:hypothetical protein
MYCHSFFGFLGSTTVTYLSCNSTGSSPGRVQGEAPVQRLDCPNDAYWQVEVQLYRFAIQLVDPDGPYVNMGPRQPTAKLPPSLNGESEI